MFMVKLNPKATCTCIEKIDCGHIFGVQLRLGLYFSKPNRKKLLLSKLKPNKIKMSGQKYRDNLKINELDAPAMEVQLNKDFL